VTSGRCVRILAAESVTELADVAGAVLVAGSHGGIIAACLAARAGVRAVILNDAGIGLDRAGIAGLPYLDDIGMAAAAVSHLSARIGDGTDMLARGAISHANRHASAVGVLPGMDCRRAAELLALAPGPNAPPPPYAEGRYLLQSWLGGIELWALDSVGKVVAEDAGRILVIGSHGALHGGRPESALQVDAIAAVFHDAGIGADGAGVTRLPALAARGIAAATVGCMSARIGDGRSCYATGIISRVNWIAERMGVMPGMQVPAFIQLVMHDCQA
jgi:hypothetical protein